MSVTASSTLLVDGSSAPITINVSSSADSLALLAVVVCCVVQATPLRSSHPHGARYIAPPLGSVARKSR